MGLALLARTIWLGNVDFHSCVPPNSLRGWCSPRSLRPWADSECKRRVTETSWTVMISFLVVLWRFACRCFYFCVTEHASPSPITHVPNPTALTVLMNSPQPTGRTERAVSRPVSTFLQTPNDSVDSEGASSSESASSLVSASISM